MTDKSVFISYRRDKNSQLPILIEDRLRKLDYDVFIDLTMGAGTDIWQTIAEKIVQQDVFIVILASSTLESKAVRAEIQMALEQRKPIVPVTTPDFSWDQSFPQEIQQLKNFNGVVFPSHDQSYAAAFFEKLIAAIEMSTEPQPLDYRERLEKLLQRKYGEQKTRFSVV